MEENNRIPGMNDQNEWSPAEEEAKDQAPAAEETAVPDDQAQTQQNEPYEEESGSETETAHIWQNPWEVPLDEPEVSASFSKEETDNASPSPETTQAPASEPPQPSAPFVPPAGPANGYTYNNPSYPAPQPGYQPYSYQPPRPGYPYTPYYGQGYYQQPYGAPVPPKPPVQQPGAIQWNSSEYHGKPKAQDPADFGAVPPAEPPKEPDFNESPYSAPQPAGDGDKPPKKKMSTGLKVFLWIMGVLVGGFILGFCGYGIYSAAQGGVPEDLPSSSSSSSAPDESTPGDEDAPSSSPTDPNASVPQEDQPAGNEKTAKEIYQQAAQSVVGIVIYDKDAELSQGALSEGSGVVVTESGYIMTNSHVINNSKEYVVKVVLSDGEEYDAQVVGFDTRTDLAVIKVDKTGLTPATFGNSDQLSVGDSVLAIGNPGGTEFASSLTRGIVSAVNRTVGDDQVKYIQTDAAINPGNSGGALLNMYGQVIGINTAKIKDTAFEGMAFAIPINTARTIVDDLIKNGYVTGRMRLGMSVQAISDYEAQMYRVPQGLLIASIDDDSDLTNQGVRVNDIIYEVNGKEITSINVLYEELENCEAGDTVTLGVYRMGQTTAQGKSFEVKVKVLEDRGQS